MALQVRGQMAARQVLAPVTINMRQLRVAVAAFMCLHKLLMLCMLAVVVVAAALTGGVETVVARAAAKSGSQQLQILTMLTAHILEKVELNQQAAQLERAVPAQGKLDR